MADKPIRYSHAFDIAFEVVSETDDGSDVTAEMAFAALTARCQRLMRDNEMLEAIGAPFDTYEMEEDEDE